MPNGAGGEIRLHFEVKADSSVLAMLRSMNASPLADGRTAAADPAETYDVAVLGGHLSAGLLGAVLARQGVRVLLVDAPDDRSERSGETTVPYTAEVFLLLAKRFDVPEIGAFGLFPDLPEELRRRSGMNRSLGYLYHRAGRRQSPGECVQFIVPGEHSEWHPYRPETDRYARQLAVRYGAARPPGGAVLEDAWTEGGAGRVRTSDGSQYRARYLVDAAGPGSPLLARNGGDSAEPWLRHRSRVYATQMRRVTPFEDLIQTSRYRRCGPWSLGTVNHLFDGGWLQLVNFGNHDESDNGLTSVTLSVDPDRYRDLPEDPEQAFRSVIERYPDLVRQLDGATVDGRWTVSARYQRTAARTHGEGWFAMERTASRNDMFLARDITVGAEVVHALAAALIGAVRSGDWAAKPFDRVARLQDDLNRYNDRLLNAARIACTDFRLWNAFSRVWLVWQQLAHLSLRRARSEGEATGGEDWSAAEEYELGALWFRAPDGLRELINRSLDLVEQAGEGRITAAQAAGGIFAGLRREPFVPPLPILKKRRTRVYHYSWPQRMRMLLWLKRGAPADFRRLLTPANVLTTRPPVAEEELPDGTPVINAHR
jgi:FADH2 O2-dependent halogenase